MPSRIEIINEFHTTRSFGTQENVIARSKEVNQTYRDLTEPEIAEIVQGSLADGDDLVALVCLACLHPGSLKPFHQQFIEHGLVHPPVIYHEADEQCSAALADRITTAVGSHQKRDVLLCMAWAGNDEVQRLFASWRDARPAWAADLDVPPHAHANEAGWELLPNGKRHDLFYRTALPLIPPDSASQTVTGVKVGTPRDQHCPWCGRQLVSLLDVDSECEAVSFLRPSSPRLQVTTCDVCSAFGVVFSKNDGSGESVWHPANVRPDYLPDDSSDWPAFPERPLVLSGEHRHFMQSANWIHVPGVAFSQIGGLPTWVQYAEYPNCPDCSRKMLFIGQISNEDFDSMMEGIEYCFHCPQCNVTATSYQQS